MPILSAYPEELPAHYPMLKNSDLERRRQAFVAVGSEVKFGRCASRGEDRLRKGDELRQLPQILGGGGQ